MRLGKNVFQIWHENGEEVPFLVRKPEWHGDSYFMVTRIEVSPEKWKHFDKTGDIYGKAFGFFYRRGERVTVGGPTELSNSGVYKWRRVFEEKMRLLWSQTGGTDTSSSSVHTSG